MAPARWVRIASLIILMATTLSACTIPLKISPAAPSLVPTQASPLDVSAVAFDLKNPEYKTWGAVMHGLTVDQRVLAEPALSQFMREDLEAFVKLHTRIEPTAPAEIRITIHKARIVTYKYPLIGDYLPPRAIGAESGVTIALLRNGAPAAACEFSDPVLIDGAPTLTRSLYRESAERLVTRYRQELVNALEKRCSPIF